MSARATLILREEGRFKDVQTIDGSLRSPTDEVTFYLQFL